MAESIAQKSEEFHEKYRTEDVRSLIINQVYRPRMAVEDYHEKLLKVSKFYI